MSSSPVPDGNPPKAGVIFEVLVQPRARKNEIAGMQGDAVKVRITAPPVEGKANQACIDLIAEALRLKRNEIELISGHTARKKRFRLVGITTEEFRRRLNNLVE